MITITFPEYTGIRCLMMPYVQGDPNSLPDRYGPYREIVEQVFLKEGERGYLTIDESFVEKGKPQRGDRAKHGRALHTEAGLRPYSGEYAWGGGGWGSKPNVTLERNTKILISSNTDGTSAYWDAEHFGTSFDGDIGDKAEWYPYEDANVLGAGEVAEIGILTPHESLPVEDNINRQFLRIVGEGVHGRESYFSRNPKIAA